jgi:hypothetical protein
LTHLFTFLSRIACLLFESLTQENSAECCFYAPYPPCFLVLTACSLFYCCTDDGHFPFPHFRPEIMSLLVPIAPHLEVASDGGMKSL